MLLDGRSRSIQIHLHVGRGFSPDALQLNRISQAFGLRPGDVQVNSQIVNLVLISLNLDTLKDLTVVWHRAIYSAAGCSTAQGRSDMAVLIYLRQAKVKILGFASNSFFNGIS
jgi:hypothetical protein